MVKNKLSKTEFLSKGEKVIFLKINYHHLIQYDFEKNFQAQKKWKNLACSQQARQSCLQY